MDWFNRHKTLVGYVIVFAGGGVRALAPYTGLDVLDNIGAAMIGLGGGFIVAGRTPSDAQAKSK